MVKEKLTLSVDREVVEKAKELGVNISKITEKILRGYTAAQKPEGSLYDGYEQLFDSIAPLLREYNVAVVIARDYLRAEEDPYRGYRPPVPGYPFDVKLTPKGDFWVDEFEAGFKDIRQINLDAFLSPKEILRNLMDAFVKSGDVRREKLKEILMAKRIIEAISAPLIERTSFGETQFKDTAES